MEPVEKVLAANVASLMKLHQLDQHQIAKRTGISQKTFSNILTASVSTSIKNVATIAETFRVPIWALLDDRLPPQHSKRVGRLLAQWLASDDAGREHIEMVAERESGLTKR
jgi:transcriptional regulator with XRE-family HTH domain